MRKVSFGLGLAGGILAILTGIFSAIALLVFKNIDFVDIGKNLHIPDFFEHGGSFFSNFKVFSALSAFYWVGIAITLAAGILGIIGAAILKNKNIPAGVLMLVGGGLCFVGGSSTLVAALLIAAGVLALVKPKEKLPEVTQE